MKIFTRKHTDNDERDDLAEDAKPGRRARRKPLGGRAAETKLKSDWALRGVVGHITFAGGGDGDRMIAWYVADPQQWSFRSTSEGEDLITSAASTLSELVGTTVYTRVTSRPYPVPVWARRAWANAPAPQPGFDEMMERDQRHMARTAQADKLVFYGVDLGSRATALRVLARLNSGVVTREMEALQERLDAVDAIMTGNGVEAEPASAAEMEWLLVRSLSIGCPIPVPADGEPEAARLDSDDLASMTSQVTWTAEPLASAVKVTSVVGAAPITRYVVVLTVGRCADIDIPAEHEPWMSKSDRLPFEVEWSTRTDLRAADEISREMTKLGQRIDSQMRHWRDDHSKTPPRQLARQASRTAEVEDEMRTGFTGLHTRTKGWYRCAVSGRTEREAVDRANRLIELYKPQIRLEREIGQYAILREFVPGEPLGSAAHSRKWPIMKWAAGLPAITADVGDKRGPHLGETTGITARAVCHDPWVLPEVIEVGGLIPVIGGLGAGKSMLMGTMSYKHILSGVCGAAMDPAGRLQRLMRLPEIAAVSRSVDVIGGLPGTLSPYGVVPDPTAELVRLDCDDPTSQSELDERMDLARNAARATRRELSAMAIRWTLPYRLGAREDVQDLIREAINSSRDDRAGSINEVASWVQHQGGDLGQKLARELSLASESELGRLLFRPHGRLSTEDVLDEYATARFVFFNLKGLTPPDKDLELADQGAAQLLYKPIMTLASWCALTMIYRRDPHERKLFTLDEAHEITDASSSGRQLVTKISTDSRKNNLVAYCGTQNASNVIGEKSIANYAGAVFIGRTQDEQAQRDALQLLGKPIDRGYEKVLGNLSRRNRKNSAVTADKTKGGDLSLDYREFIYRDGLGGEGGKGGMEKIRLSIKKHHPALFEALNSTADPNKRVNGNATEVA